MADVTEETLKKLIAVLNKLEGKSDGDVSTSDTDQSNKVKTQQKMADIRRDALRNARELRDVEDATLKAIEDQIKAEEKKLDLLVKEGTLTEEQANQSAQIIEQLKEQASLQKTINADTDQILSSFFGINNETKQFAKVLKDSGGLMGYTKKMAGGLKKSLSLANIQAALLKKSFQNIKKLAGSIGKEIMKPVAASTDLASTIELATKRQDQFRLAAREVGDTTGKSIQSLGQKFMRLGQETDGTAEDFMRINKVMYNTSAVFRELKAANDPAREGLEKTAQMLERRFMVPIEDVTRSADILGKTFGMNTTQTTEFQEALTATFSSIGLDGKKALSDFAAESATLAKFSLPDIKKEFTGLAAISQKTGISIGDMTGALENFSTFEGALTSAAKLNAAFGTTIDGMEIMDVVMTKGPVAGLIKLREILEDTGIEADKLGTAGLRALSDAFGMNEAQMKSFQNVSVETLQGLADQGLSAAEIQKKINEGRKDAMTTEEKIAKNISNAADNMNKVGEAIDDATRFVSDFIKGWEHVIGLVKVFGGLLVSMVIGSLIKSSGLVKGLLSLGATAAGGAGAAGAGGAGAAGAGAAGAGAAGAAAGAGALVTGAAVVGAAGVGAWIGDKINEAIYGEGNYDYNFRGVFAPGQNYISKPTIATVGDAGPEMISSRAQRLLQPGSSVTRTSESSGSPTNLTINLVGKEGKILDTSTQTISESQMDKAISHYLNTKVSLLNS